MNKKASSIILVFGIVSALVAVFLIKSKLSSRKIVSLVYFADLHGHFEEHPELFWKPDNSSQTETSVAGGLARMFQFVSDLRLSNPDGVLFMDAGDTIQGAAAVAMSKGDVAVPLLNSMKIDLAIPGNWEVVYGTAVFRKLAEKVNYPFIASNILDAETGELVFPPYFIKTLNDVRFAIIGFTDPDVPTRQPPSFSEGFIYKGAEVLQPLVDGILNKDQADVIVLLTHIGLPKAVHLAEKLKGVDVILSSDTHERTYDPVIRGNTWIVEAGAFGSFLGQLDIELKADGSIDKKWTLVELRESLYNEDKSIAKLVDKSLQPYKVRLDKKIGETTIPLVRYNVLETTMDAVLADALRDATGTEIALSNGFRFAYPIVPGPIKESDLWSVYPINTQIKTGKITGQQIKDFFEREIENVFSNNPDKLFGGWLPRPSGISMEFDLSKPLQNRITGMHVNGQPLEEDRSYTVTTCVREGDPETTLCRIPNGTNIRILDFDAHEAVRRYLKKHAPLVAPEMNRIKIRGLTGDMRSQFFKN